MLGFTKVFAIAAVAAAPLTLGASFYGGLDTHAQAEVPSAAKAEALKDIPCPGLAALISAGKFDRAVKDWTNPVITMTEAEGIFQETFNLAPDFTKFTMTAAAKLTKPQPGNEPTVNLNNIRSWGPTQVYGQIVHPGCMSRKDPVNVGNNKDTPRPFDDARFKTYLGHLGTARKVTLAAQAKARKAEVDVQKDLRPMEWFNVWAESALLMCVLSGGNCAEVELHVIDDFFRANKLPAPPKSAIDMAKLGKTTVELIFEAYRGDLKGLLGLFTGFAKQGLSQIAQGVKVNIHDIIARIAQRNPAIEAALSGNESSS